MYFAVLKVWGVDLDEVEHLVQRDYYYLLICHACCLYLVCCLFSLFLFWFLLEFLVSHLKVDFQSDWWDQVFFLLTLHFLDLLTASNLPCLGIICCFSGLKFGSNSFCTPWTSRSFVLLVLSWEHVWIRYFSLSILYYICQNPYCLLKFCMC